MPKILRILNRFNLGGPTYNAAYLAKYLSSDFETTLIGGVKDELEDSSEFIVQELGLKPIIIPEMKRAISFKDDRTAYRKILKIIKEYQPDIVHTHASKAGTLGRLAAIKSKVPVIVHTFHGHVFHSYFGKTKTLMYKSIERYLAKKSSGIIAISEKQKNELADIHNICPANKITVIPLGFDLSRFTENMEDKRLAFRKAYNLDNDEIAIGIVGRIVPVKNHELFIEALKRVRERTSNKIRAFIVGDGESKGNIQLKARSVDLDFIEAASDFNRLQAKAINKSAVTFTGWIRDIDYVYAGMDIIALTSLNEGTPVSLIEAQAANKPIVSTNVGGIENVVKPGNTALLSEIGNPGDFSEKLLSLVDNTGLRNKIGSEGRGFAIGKFHYDRLIKETKNLYNNLLQQT